MKVKTKDKIVNLEKFDKIRIIPKDKNRIMDKLCDDNTATGFYIDASRQETSGGLFGGTCTIEEEIVGVATRKVAEKVLSIMIEHWTKGTKLFEIKIDESGIMIHTDETDIVLEKDI